MLWLTLHKSRGLLPLLLLAVAGLFAWLYTRIPPMPDPQPPRSIEASWSPPVLMETARWEVMQASGGAETGTELPYRLAGTFTQAGEAGSSRIAIIDALRDQKQYLLHEMDPLDDYIVERVFTDRVVLARGDERTTLWQGGATPKTTEGQIRTVQDNGPKTFEEAPALDTNRFGKRIGESRWVFKREALLAYQQELMDDPERLARLYLSFKTEKTETGNTTGFSIAPSGEQDFFELVGLRQNDIVRSVNSMKMTSEQRAEMFLREFSRDRLGALVLDIERDGEAHQNIYIFR